MNPAEHLKLWDIADGVIITSHGVLVRGYELTGLDQTSTTEQEWETVAEALYQGLKKLPDFAFMQFIIEQGHITKNDFPDIKVDDEIKAYQRKCRNEYLLSLNLRKTKIYLFFGSTVGLNKSEFKTISNKEHKKQLSRLQDLEGIVSSVLRRAKLGFTELTTKELFDQFRAGLDPESKPYNIRREPYPDGAPELIEDWMLPLSIREQLFPGDVSWDKDYVQAGDYYFRVLAAKKLPDNTTLKALTRLPTLNFDYRVVINIAWPDQGRTQAAFKQRRRFFHSAAQKTNAASDIAQEVALSEADDLGLILEDEGQKLLKIGIQAVTWSKSEEALKVKSSRLYQAFSNLDIQMYFEQNAHDFELFKSLPGMATTFDRWRLVSSNVAADLIPVSSCSKGDKNPVIHFEVADTGELFGYTPREWGRANDNALILGASGGGKSVLMNMTLSNSMLSGPTKGRVLAVDYAGPAKSSFKTATEVFGGKYIPISGEGKKINPWPEPKIACGKNGKKVMPETLAYLSSLANILLNNTEDNKDCALFSAIIQQGIKDVYWRIHGDKAPLFDDLMDVFKSYTGKTDIDQARLEQLITLLKKFIDGPEAELLNRPTTADNEGEFICYDLYGLKSYEQRIQSAVAFVVCQFVRNTAFDGRPDRYKYILFEEVANLLGLGMKSSIEELYTTARAHGTSVVTITQEYAAYKRSGIAGTITLNSTTRVLMSHQSAAAAMSQIIEDFELNEQEAETFRSLHCVKGQYSELMMLTSVAQGDDLREITAKLRLRLSPFDYQVVTSDAKDRALQIEYAKQFPNTPRVKISDYLAHKKAQGGDL